MGLRRLWGLSLFSVALGFFVGLVSWDSNAFGDLCGLCCLNGPQGAWCLWWLRVCGFVLGLSCGQEEGERGCG